MSRNSNMYTRPWALLALVVLPLAACSGGKQGGGTRTVYAAGPRDLAEWMCQQFEKESGHHANLFSATTGEIMAKLEAEKDQPRADVVILASPSAAEVLKQEQALADLPAGLPTRPEWTDPDHKYAGTADCALGIALRKDHDLPDLTWDQVWAGNFQGKMVMPSPEESGSSAEFVVAFDQSMGEKFWDGLKNVQQHGLQVSGPNSQALTSLVMGAQDAVLASADYLTYKQIEKGEPLVMRFPAPACPVIPRPVAILSSSAHLELAEDFVKFCFTPEVQQRIAAEHLIPADASIPLSALRQASGTLTPMSYDVAKSMQAQQMVMKRFQTEIEEAGK